jgi:hypothetical protein
MEGNAHSLVASSHEGRQDLDSFPVLPDSLLSGTNEIPLSCGSNPLYERLLQSPLAHSFGGQIE